MAEPPVADTYLAAARSGHGESPQQYLPDLPESSVRGSKAFTNTISDLTNILDRTRGISQEYVSTSFRGGLSQENGTPNLRSGTEFGSKLSQEYAPNLSTVRCCKNVSFVYSAPSLRSSPTTQYGALEFQPTNVEEYNAPFVRNSDFSNTRSSSPVRKYGVPKSRSSQLRSGSVSQEYLPSSRSNTQQAHRTLEDFSFGTQSLAKSSRNSPSQVYGTPVDSLATQYSAPEARNADAYYGESGVLSTTYNRPNGGSEPETGAALKSSTLASSYPSARSQSREDGAPSSRTAVPSPQYGASKNLDGYSDRSYENYARNSLELLNQDDKAEGTYFVVLPDETKQVVNYEADEDGFKPRISVIPADIASSGAGALLTQLHNHIEKTTNYCKI
ncbi:unnamed protein product [Parnassius apollo]|uniref:(apollo) hypothetical protein n=1 Tax=Parnassius apollo TaxID=110799 RepID=A0A8S3XB54_PARAO|nr:unnamed protein product [Parnassius apollo]